MFVQVIRAATDDAAALRERFDRWREDLAPGAPGWLDSTAGVTDEGEFVAVVRFESEAAARKNSDRPEQGEWWSGTERLLDRVTFRDTTEVETWLGGPDGDAGFVQVIEGRSDEGARRRPADVEDLVREHRPDVTGGLVAFHGDRFTQVVYFTDEASARDGESRGLPDEAEERFQRSMQGFEVDTYLDLREPWHSAAGRS